MTQYSGVFSLQQQGQALTSGQWCTDPYYKNTTLLLHADGVANGAQNNTFLDSSTNAFSITRNGNTTQGSFTPYGPTWSNYFDGSSAYLTATNNTAYAFGTGDFTVEAWVYLVSTPSGQMVVGSTYQNSSSGFTFSIESNVLKVRMLGDPVVVSGSTTVTPNAWHHVAVSRSGTSLKVFLDGAQDGSATNSDNVALNSTAFNIARLPNSSGYLAGYVSNLRVVKGTAVYTAAFFPSTIPLTAITNTSLLTCQSNRFVDNSTNAFTITVGNTPAVQRFSPFAPQYQYTPAVIGGSGYFDGTSDGLIVPYNSALDFGSSDFTIEFWVYFNDVSASQGLYVTSPNSGTYGPIWLRISGSYIGLQATTSNGSWTLFDFSNNNISGALTAKTWTHFALVRSGSSWKAYVNGVNTWTATGAGSLYVNSSSISVGCFQSSDSLNGYLTDFRVNKGTAIYTGAFTPPTLSPLATSGSASAASYSSTTNVNTSFAASTTPLLLSYTNAGIYDNAMMNDLETVGNAQVSTSVVKYGSGSLAFDGTGDALAIPTDAKTNFAFGTGDFTIEFWAWKSANGSAGYDCVISIGSSGNFSGGFCVELSSSRGFCFIYDAAVQIQSNFNPNDSTWHHYAVVRNGSTFALYKDGIQLTTATLTPTLGTTGSGFVGAGVTSSQVNFNGYIDDLRVTKGVARYTANFQPPKVAFANQ